MSKSSVLSRLEIINKVSETVLVLCLFIMFFGGFVVDRFVAEMFYNFLTYLLILSIFFITVVNVSKLFFSVHKKKSSRKKIVSSGKGGLGLLVKFVALVIILAYLSVSFMMGIDTVESLFGKFVILGFFGFVWYLIVLEFKREIH